MWAVVGSSEESDSDEMRWLSRHVPNLGAQAATATLIMRTLLVAGLLNFHKAEGLVKIKLGRF